MEAVEYLNEKTRLCNSTGCYTCPLSSENNGQGVNCDDLEDNFPDISVQILEEWSINNPKKTNLKKLEEVFGVADAFRLYTNGNSIFVNWCNEKYKGGE